MSKINGNKVPWIAVLVQSVIAALFSTLIYVMAPVVLPLRNTTDAIYDIMQASVTVIWCVSMVILFVDVIIIRHKYRYIFSRIRLAPDWIFYLCSLLGSFASVCGVYVIFTAPWTSTLTTGIWDVWIVSITVVSLIAAVVVFYIGQKTIRSHISDEDLIAEVTR